MGRSVLDRALWDIRCKSHGEPLWLELGGHKDSAQVYSTGLGPFLSSANPTGKEMNSAAEQMAEIGHRAFKLSVIDVAQLALVREAVEGTTSDLRWAIDIAQVWDTPTPLR